MEYSWVYAMVITFLVLLWLFVTPKQNLKNMPPSPPSLPIIGHLHLLNINKPFHRALHDLSIKYGPIYYIKIGRVPMLVISSPALVEECLTKNDIVLANRPCNRNTFIFHYDSATLGAAPYGPLWRDLRKVTALELFSTTRLNILTHVREEETKSLVKGLFKNLDDVEFRQVKVRSKLFECSFNIIMRMLTGKRYVLGVDDKGASEGADNVLYVIMIEFFELSSALNPIDSFPFLRWINYGNIEGKMMDVRNKMEAFLDGVLEECKSLRTNGSSCKSGENIPMIYKLFDLQETNPKEYTDQTIKGIIMVMLLGGIDTSVVTIEWALALLLSNKHILERAQLQVDDVIGTNRVVDESDLDKLQFIQNIIDETLRLFPAAPLLLPHMSSEDCTIGGYNVPKGTMVHISAWAVQRDPNVWEDPLTFKPERFEGIAKVNNELRSSFIPFGLGRRSCPGASLGNKVTTLILSSLLQCFDWDKVDGVNVDFTEGSGLTMPMATPLIAMCKARPGMINVLSSL